MLSRAYRLSRNLFPTLLSSRNFRNASHFTLRIADPVDQKPHVAVSVSKKVAKSAVLRNTLRRRTYAVLRTLIHGLSPGLYLFVAKPGAEKIQAAELESEIRGLLGIRN